MRLDFPVAVYRCAAEVEFCCCCWLLENGKERKNPTLRLLLFVQLVVVHALLEEGKVAANAAATNVVK